MKPTSGALRRAAKALRAHGEDRIADMIEPRASIKPRSRRPSKLAREEKRSERKERAIEIRAAVFSRANGRCEFCLDHPPVEWHHILSGGLRRHRESEATTAAICEKCHRGYHDNNPVVLVGAIEWAQPYFSRALALAEIRKRYDKVLEAQRAPSLSRQQP